MGEMRDVLSPAPPSACFPLFRKPTDASFIRPRFIPPARRWLLDSPRRCTMHGRRLFWPSHRSPWPLLAGGFAALLLLVPAARAGAPDGVIAGTLGLQRAPQA